MTLSSVPPIDVLRITRSEPVSFCSHCGRTVVTLDARTRICPHCELGLILQTDRGMAPSPGDPFLVTDVDLLICAVSAGAERLLDRAEPTVIHQPVSELLTGVGSGVAGTKRLPELLRAAATGPIGVVETVVSLVASSGEQYTARLGSCGPPAAALLVIGSPVPFTGPLL